MDPILKATRSGPGTTTDPATGKQIPKNWFDNPFGMPGPGDKASSGNWLTSWAPYEHLLTVDIPHWWDVSRHAVAAVWGSMWSGITSGNVRYGHSVEAWFDGFRHSTANVFNGIRHDISGYWDDIGKATDTAWNVTWNNTIGRLNRGRHDVAHGFDDFRHATSNVWDGVRHDIAAAWDTTWNNTVTRLTHGAHDTEHGLDVARHTIADTWDGVRHDASSTWDTIWNNTVARARSGTGSLLRWVGSIPGKVESYFKGAGRWLYSVGQQVVQGFLNGLLSIWHKVTSWISSIAGWIKAHKGPISLDARLLVPAGRALMSGLHLGLLGGFGPIASFISGVGNTLGDLISKGGQISKMLGFGGTANWGVMQYAGLVSAVLKMLHQPGSALGVVLKQMTTESGGNRYAVNRSDINWQEGHPSVGLMQVIRGTFDTYAGPFRNVGPFMYGVSTNPLANIFAGLNYAIHAYPGRWMSVLGQGHGYATGTSGAAAGWALVGERGPEYVRFRGGEQVLPHGTTPKGGDGIRQVPLVAMYGTTIREDADVQTLAQKMDFRIRASWMG